MKPTIKLTRRQALATGAALPLAGVLPASANAAADMMGPDAA